MGFFNVLADSVGDQSPNPNLFLEMYIITDVIPAEAGIQMPVRNNYVRKSIFARCQNAPFLLKRHWIPAYAGMTFLVVKHSIIRVSTLGNY